MMLVGRVDRETGDEIHDTLTFVELGLFFPLEAMRQRKRVRETMTMILQLKKNKKPV